MATSTQGYERRISKLERQLLEEKQERHMERGELKDYIMFLEGRMDDMQRQITNLNTDAFHAQRRRVTAEVADVHRKMEAFERQIQTFREDAERDVDRKLKEICGWLLQVSAAIPPSASRAGPAEVPQPPPPINNPVHGAQPTGSIQSTPRSEPSESATAYLHHRSHPGLRHSIESSHPSAPSSWTGTPSDDQSQRGGEDYMDETSEYDDDGGQLLEADMRPPHVRNAPLSEPSLQTVAHHVDASTQTDPISHLAAL
mmetsp:Transcript_1146/g.2536  ORF Transcript_1146/g.2536 Transcript_1146/m.2536 type:complete len:257 (-) Transcript_1146:39-809(-)|eukprot:CAMPEP_0206434970 /NCGR_PEP_ID=MMETSP0324_2-20121206/9537_1 /ASSEMBLY_ACC=CAM_ASM_000836 /TAXON_ID=2866 /ORGANISM="Crypthecodinium cohnii, Strain Seligo" /LENGTH=256 /DNA_ID=CAMNT_0053901711 /DNA_START=486 /DNA_END=1256 /DNA_ORIENTATION=+